MTKIAITTVGISLFDNYEEKKEKIDNREQIKNDKAQTSVLEKFKKTYTQKIVNWAKSAKSESCAEIKTLIKMGITNTYLLTTDTQEGELVGELLKQILLEIGISVIKKEKVVGLKVDDPNSFKDKGFFNLIKHIRDIKTIQKKKGNDVVLNGSGGYKAILPVLTIVGQLEGIDLCYIYKDDKSELITIGNLPIHFDWDIINEKALFLKSEFKPVFESVLEKINILKNNEVISNNQGKLNKSSRGYQLFQQSGNESLKALLEASFNIKSVKDIKEFIDKYNPIYKLINMLEKDKLFEIQSNSIANTIIGDLLLTYSNSKISGDLGYIMEDAISNYIESNQWTELENYKFIEKSKKLGGKFFVSNKLEFKLLNDGKSYKEIPKEQQIDIGDIDIVLKCEQIDVLCEVKSFRETIDYQTTMGKSDDYYYKIKARVERLIETRQINDKNKSIEFIFLVYQLQIKGFEIDVDVKTIINHFKTKFKSDYKDTNIKFKTMTLVCYLDVDEFKYLYFKQNPLKENKLKVI